MTEVGKTISIPQCPACQSFLVLRGQRDDKVWTFKCSKCGYQWYKWGDNDNDT